jgi:hypothetical protein
VPDEFTHVDRLGAKSSGGGEARESREIKLWNWKESSRTKVCERYAKGAERCSAFCFERGLGVSKKRGRL